MLTYINTYFFSYIASYKTRGLSYIQYLDTLDHYVSHKIYRCEKLFILIFILKSLAVILNILVLIGEDNTTHIKCYNANGHDKFKVLKTYSKV